MRWFGRQDKKNAPGQDNANASGAVSMTLDELVEEGRRLARPCVYLKDTGPGPVVGIWYERDRDAGRDGLESTGELLWLVIDSTCVPGFPALPEERRYLAVYSNERDCVSGRVEERPAMEDTVCKRRPIPLYAHDANPLPPLDAVFARGSERVGEWLQAHGWERDWGYNGNFGQPGRTITREYERLWTTETPSWAHRDVYAILGGWHDTGPDDDWNDLIDENLVLWTHLDIEPSVQVWRTAEGGYKVILRIT
jgi:hypothetical protein